MITHIKKIFNFIYKKTLTKYRRNLGRTGRTCCVNFIEGSRRKHVAASCNGDVGNRTVNHIWMVRPALWKQC